ncbi:MAG: hypothetical protein J5I90_09005 [Caldilineales bacterium]|nr:hypothetical protein [Caldilineales bacterium]
MTNQFKRGPSLHQMATYQIRVPGRLDASWLEWSERLAIMVEDENGEPVSVLTGRFDQAALQGLLRQLYAIGLPLISVVWINES